MARPAKNKLTNAQSESGSYWQKLEGEVQNNQSKVSMILGGLIILVVIVLIFNYFNKNKPDINGSAPNIEQQVDDISPQNLPGEYTVKQGDTLFLIAEKYYGDGYKYPEIVKENNLSDINKIEVGQILKIPKPEEPTLPQPTQTDKAQPSATPQADKEIIIEAPAGSKGSPDASMGKQQDWGPKIISNTYTVVEGDWLSKIAGRAYGDIFAYDRIAKTNNILNPDYIEPGMVLIIPR